MRLKISKELEVCFLGVLRKYSIAVKNEVSASLDYSITEDERQMLIDAISSEFAETGIGDDSEPNQRGILLERLLDLVNKFED